VNTPAWLELWLAWMIVPELQMVDSLRRWRRTLPLVMLMTLACSPPSGESITGFTDTVETSTTGPNEPLE